MRPLRAFLLALAGILLVQAAWVLVVPPFRGLDEHEHALRADSAAHGQLGPLTDEVSGAADVVDVDADLVAASSPICRAFPKGIAVNCEPLSQVVDGRVLMRSSAAAYHPTFYVIVGLAASPFEGYAELYAMRAAGALLCALLLAGGLVVARRRLGTWSAWGLVVALTPTATYSTMVAAPNGVEIAAAALLWCALLALGRAPASTGARSLIVLAGLASVVLCTVRTLGPVWVLLIVATAVAMIGVRSVVTVLSRHRILSLATAAAVAAATAWSAWWTLSVGTNDPSGLDAEFDPPGILSIIGQPALWIAQAMGAFPARDELAPSGVLALMVGVYWVVLAVVWPVAGRRGRLVLLLTTVVSIAVPMAISLATHAQLGFSWQGRYGWPYTMGLALLSGYLLDSRAAASTRQIARLATVGRGAILLVLASATAWAQIDVLRDQLGSSPLADSTDWVRAPAAVIALITLCGFALIAFAATPAPTAIPEPDSLADSLDR